MDINHNVGTDILHKRFHVAFIVRGGKPPLICNRELLLHYTQIGAYVFGKGVENLHLLVILYWKVIRWIDNSPPEALTI